MKKGLAIALTVLLAGVLVFCLIPRERYVVLVSLDGFRWDYPTLYDAPNIDEIAEDGVSADMFPSYPASTFPNHYAIATGLVPDHNGLVNNSFWAPDQQAYYSMGYIGSAQTSISKVSTPRIGKITATSRLSSTALG